MERWKNWRIQRKKKIQIIKHYGKRRNKNNKSHIENQ